LKKDRKSARIFIRRGVRTARTQRTHPDWKEKGAPLDVPATEDHFSFPDQNKILQAADPPQMHNKGNYIISLGVFANGWQAKPKRWALKSTQALRRLKFFIRTAAPSRASPPRHGRQ